MMIQGDFPDLAELKRLAELVPALDERRCLVDPEEHGRRFVEEVVRLFDTDYGMAKAFISEVERLQAENEALRKAVNFSVEMFGKITSGDGSGHADLSRAVLRIAGAALAGDDVFRKDAERYRWLQRRLIGVLKDWDDRGKGMLGLSFMIPGDAWRTCDENIDAAMAGAGH